MKWKSHNLILLFLFSVLLSACTPYNRIDTVTVNSKDGSKQLADTSENDTISIITSTEEEKSQSTISPENIETKLNVDSNTDSFFQESNQQYSYYGDWVIQKVLAYGIGTYSSDDAEKLVGKSLNFSADKASVFTDQPSDTALIINNPEYQETTESKSDFQSNYKMSFDKLGIKTDSVTQVQISDQNVGYGELLIKDSNTIIMVAGGTYFELVKQ